MSDEIKCGWCGNQLEEDEAENPRIRDGETICDECYHEHYEFTCCRCENYEETDHQHVFIVIFEETDGLCEVVKPGIYEIIKFPYFANGMIQGYVYQDALRLVRKKIDFEQGDYPAGHLCRDCRKKLTLRQSKAGKALHSEQAAPSEAASQEPG